MGSGNAAFISDHPAPELRRRAAIHIRRLLRPAQVQRHAATEQTYGFTMASVRRAISACPVSLRWMPSPALNSERTPRPELASGSKTSITQGECCGEPGVQHV